jgi:hypothetical protein
MILAKLLPSIPEHGLADIAAIACRGLVLADLYLVKHAVVCRERAAVPTIRGAAAMSPLSQGSSL